MNVPLDVVLEDSVLGLLHHSVAKGVPGFDFGGKQLKMLWYHEQTPMLTGISNAGRSTPTSLVTKGMRYEILTVVRYLLRLALPIAG